MKKLSTLLTALFLVSLLSCSQSGLENEHNGNTTEINAQRTGGAAGSGTGRPPN